MTKGWGKYRPGTIRRTLRLDLLQFRLRLEVLRGLIQRLHHSLSHGCDPGRAAHMILIAPYLQQSEDFFRLGVGDDRAAAAARRRRHEPESSILIMSSDMARPHRGPGAARTAGTADRLVWLRLVGGFTPRYGGRHVSSEGRDRYDDASGIDSLIRCEYLAGQFRGLKAVSPKFARYDFMPFHHVGGSQHGDVLRADRVNAAAAHAVVTTDAASGQREIIE